MQISWADPSFPYRIFFVEIQVSHLLYILPRNMVLGGFRPMFSLILAHCLRLLWNAILEAAINITQLYSISSISSLG